MRGVLLAGALLSLRVAAWADSATAVVPVAIQPFRARCFDDARLAERVRARLPAQVPVTVGRSPAGPHQTVRVGGDGITLTVTVTARNKARQVVGSEKRLLPEGGDCAALLDTAALIVARAATPLNAREPNAEPAAIAVEKRPPAVDDKAPPERISDAERQREREREHARELERAREVEHARELERAREVEHARELEQIHALEREFARQAQLEQRRREEEKKQKLPSDKVTRAPIDPGHRRWEADALALWIFPLDGAPSTPAGELSVGYSWPRLGLAARAGVSDNWSATASSSSGTVSVDVRRISLAVELHVDFRVRGGCVRLGAGPLLALWSVHSTGVVHPGSSLLVEPGAALRASYRLELGKAVLQAGVAADFLFVADDLTVGGVGPVTRTPSYEIAPFVSAGLQL